MNPGFIRVLAIVVLLCKELPFSSSKEPCPSYSPCGSFNLTFPFTDLKHSSCGLCFLDCNYKPLPRISLEYPSEQWLIAKSLGKLSMTLHSEFLQGYLSNKSCSAFYHVINLPSSPSIFYTLSNNITIFRCSRNPYTENIINDSYIPGFGYYNGCDTDHIFYSKTPNSHLPDTKGIGSLCTAAYLPYNKSFTIVQGNKSDDVHEVFRLLGSDYDLQWHVSDDCKECHRRGGVCSTDWSKPSRCVNADGVGKKNLALILGSVGAAFVLVVLAVFFIRRRKKGNKGLYFLSRSYSKQSSKLDSEEGSVYLGVSVFTYSELREATKNFDASKELGDGGFGTVYHGILQDGREVAVKRLYEHNSKLLEQFMNEIEILTRLRHPNLVALYGCTSRRSRELLLVYEYIPNGTIADHLHGDRGSHKYLTWDQRMSIAIEAAEALSYLHASDIIHRDVKTANILLDHFFCVKVADFGLSRFFPINATHISTAPQGTPGYVDPEYHQCYHLTDKSDVYSFGVVLIELISSIPAVDMSRDKHEINLANMAINRIQQCAFDELIDPSLGYKSDPEVMRMTTSVAELAFRCLQGEKEMRPAMGEVLQTLKDIQSFKETSIQIHQNQEAVKDKVNVFSPESEDRVLLKNAKFPSSPVSVSHLWVSCSTSASTCSN